MQTNDDLLNDSISELKSYVDEKSSIVLTRGVKEAGSSEEERRMLGWAFELAMYMSWHEDKCKKILTHDEAKEIARKLFLRDTQLSDGAPADYLLLLEVIVGMAFVSNVNQIQQLRLQRNFDSMVFGFCQSIQIKMPDVETL